MSLLRKLADALWAEGFTRSSSWLHERARLRENIKRELRAVPAPSYILTCALCGPSEPTPVHNRGKCSRCGQYGWLKAHRPNDYRARSGAGG